MNSAQAQERISAVDQVTEGESLKVPFGLRWRTSTAFISLTVGLGVVVDLSGYGLIVPIVPYRLQELGYDQVAQKSGWLVGAYAGGLIVSSPFFAYLGALITNRRIPLLVALCFMAGAIVLFMETSSYTAMIVSRILQGISGTGIWTLGTALITDSVPTPRVGAVMGQVMIGHSVGSLIGPPVGGVLYGRMGYRAPFVFALCLIFFDFALRLLVIEKHVALKYIEQGYDIPDFEAPGYRRFTMSEREDHGCIGPVGQVEKEAEKGPKASTWSALMEMVTKPRPVTSFLLSFMCGYVIGGLLETCMTLWLEQEYHLTSLGAGLVFIAIVVPPFFGSPLAGWASDKRGAKWIAFLGLVLCIPAFLLLIIKGPLPLFVFFLVFVGFAISFLLAPIMQDLSIVVNLTPGLPSTAAYGTFNMAYSVGAFVGPIVGGQVLGSLGIRKGWMVVCILSAVLVALSLLPTALYLGGSLRKRSEKDDVEGKGLKLESVAKGQAPAGSSDPQRTAV
ncbi:MFS general substrate transporter [Meredithblackwellia eburnea MCA 4105]